MAAHTGIMAFVSRVVFVLCLPILYFIAKVIYRIFFHPLARFPGPLVMKASRIPYLYKHINGTLPFDIADLHARYGKIVRVAPDELAICHPDAWQDVHGHAKTEEFAKASWFYHPIDSPTHIVNESRERHGRIRRQMAHGFSEKSMREQEPIIKTYVDLLVHKLREEATESQEPVVISRWYNWTTFDVIGSLAFGEPFGCLENATETAWIKGIVAGGRMGTFLQSLSFYPLLKSNLLKLVPASVRASHEVHKKRTEEKMLRRMKKGGQPDLIDGLLGKQDQLELSVAQLVANAEILIIGGSETTASLLCGATFYLLTHLDVLQKVKNEIRSTFKDDSEITLLSVGRLEYMLAVLNESLRMYPPIANGLPRIVPASGALIAGEYVPGGTYVAVHHWALYRAKEFFKDADEFHPERFLGDARYKDDRKEVLQPFQVGPRSCLGRNLAYAEMRLILARVLYNFDMKLAEESQEWIKQKNYLMWSKPPLKAYLTPVERGEKKS